MSSEKRAPPKVGSLKDRMAAFSNASSGGGGSKLTPSKLSPSPGKLNVGKFGGGGSGSTTPGRLNTPNKFKATSPPSSTTTPGKLNAPNKFKATSPPSSTTTPGRLNAPSKFKSTSPSPGKLSSTPGKLSTPTSGSSKLTPSKLSGGTPTNLKVRVTEASFKPKVETDKGIREAFAAGELIVDGEKDDSDVVNLKEVLANLKKEGCLLDKLVLRKCQGLDDAFATSLAQNGLSELLYIDLSKNGLSESAQMAVMEACMQSNRVTNILLEGNDKLGAVSCDRISALLLDNRAIMECKANFEIPPTGLDKITQRNCQVMALQDRIKKSGAFALSRRISIRDNELVVAMMKAEANDPSVHTIKVFEDPRFVHISNSITLGFADGLRCNLYLKSLTIVGVDLDNPFLSSIATSIETNFTLQEINLSRNAFTSDGMSEFCQAMGVNLSVRRVDLRNQHSPLSSGAVGLVMESLTKNETVREFYIDFRSQEAKGKLDQILQRNKEKKKTFDYDKKLVEFLNEEAKHVEEVAEQRRLDALPVEIPDDDWEYLWELHEQAKRYQWKLKTEDGKDEDDGAESSATTPTKPGRKTPSRTVSDASGLDRLKLRLPPVHYTDDGSFLTEEFIAQYIVDNADYKSVIFDFCGQFKMFKRFPVESPSRNLIVFKFVEAILTHPRSKELTGINMANSFCGNDFVIALCEKCLRNSKLLPNLHLLNLETNFISEPGVVALSKCIEKKETWKYLQSVKLENQKFLFSSVAEKELAKALFVNRSVIKVNLRVRNILERDRIAKYTYRNMDLLRQARRRHQLQSGTAKERKRNMMEKYLDRIVNNDPDIVAVEIVADQLFLALNKTETMRAATAFAKNTQVTTCKLSLLKLDDAFAIELAKSLETNTAIQVLNLENNNLSGDGIKAIFASLAKNKTIMELSVRHQSKNMASTAEEELLTLLGNNSTLTKLGVDVRSMGAKNSIDRRIRDNQDRARRNRRNSPKRSRSVSTEGKIKSVVVQKMLERVARGDEKLTAVTLMKSKEFINLEGFRKAEFYESLKTNKVVTVLNLCDLQLDNSFADTLVSILKTNSTLQEINLDKNWFTSLGVYTIAMAVIPKKNVTKLSLMKPRAKISNEEAERLLEALEKECYLKEFGIQFRDEAHTERLAKILQK